MSKLKTVVSNICVSGLKVTFVPRRLVVPVISSSAGGRAALVALLVDLTVAPDFEIERLRQRVDDRDADAVQPARHLVAVVVELAAGVQHREHDFGGRFAAGVPIDRNAAAVVDDGHRSVDVNGDVDLIAEAGERLVDGVVDDLVDEMMQPGRPGRADVHRGPLADGLQPLEDLDLVGGIVVDVWRAWPPWPVVAFGGASGGGWSGSIAVFGSPGFGSCVHSAVHTRIGMIT